MGLTPTVRDVPDKAFARVTNTDRPETWFAAAAVWKIRQLRRNGPTHLDAVDGADARYRRFCAVLVGTVPAFMFRNVKSVRTSLSAIIVIVALAGLTGLSAFLPLIHPVCTAMHHDCGQAPTLKACCCGDQSNISDRIGPTAAKVTCRVTLIRVATVVADIAGLASQHAFTTAHASLPRSSSVDRSTLVATLLI